MITTPDEYRKFKKLESISACGSTESNNALAIALGYQMYENFRAGRNLKYSGIGSEIIPWLYKARNFSKKWHETYDVRPPFHDHFRFFVDADTKQRIATIQPYLFTVAGGVQTLQKEFRDIYYKREELDYGRRKAFQPLPRVPVVVDTINAVLDKARTVSTEFADKYGLEVKVSFNGWYNPERVILIEYTKAVQH